MKYLTIRLFLLSRAVLSRTTIKCLGRDWCRSKIPEKSRLKASMWVTESFFRSGSLMANSKLWKCAHIIWTCIAGLTSSVKALENTDIRGTLCFAWSKPSLRTSKTEWCKADNGVPANIAWRVCPAWACQAESTWRSRQFLSKWAAYSSMHHVRSAIERCRFNSFLKCWHWSHRPCCPADFLNAINLLESFRALRKVVHDGICTWLECSHQFRNNWYKTMGFTTPR